MPKYMIHAMPARMWYVEEFLIPSMLAQGIERQDITVWNDTERLGNLAACHEAFLSCTDPGGTWHIQDDVIISRDFAARTKQHDDGVVYGFCSPYFNDDCSIAGRVYPPDMWNSFQCVRIPNAIARECVEWFRSEGKTVGTLLPVILANKGDDTIFHEFFESRHGRETALNLKPCLVNHVDYLIGGSVVNEWRGYFVQAEFWEDEDLLQDLKARLKARTQSV